jgi:hypothetical protein
MLSAKLTHTGQASANLVDILSDQRLQAIRQLLIKHKGLSRRLLSG